MKKIVIIGAGLAGLSLASELVANKEFEIIILEKNPYLGGRASNTKDYTMHDAIPIGPHVFVTAYNNLRRFFRKINVKNTISWERKRFIEIVYKGQHDQFNKLHFPAPLDKAPWFLHYKFDTWHDKFNNIRFANRLLFATKEDIEKLDNENAYSYLLRNGITKNGINKLWRFFGFSMLNVPLELCSAGEFVLLMKHWASIKNSAFGFAKMGLGDEYTGKAEEYIREKKGKILKNTHVEEIVFAHNKIDHLRVRENGSVKKITADIYVSSMNPIDLRSYLPVKEVLFNDFFRNLNAFEGVPYISVNLWFDKKITRKKFWAMLDDSDTPTNMNTDFYDQSNIYKTHKRKSFITSNIIYSKPYEHLTDGQIIDKTVSELRETFPHLDAKIIHSEIHRTSYVVYAVYPGMRKHKLSQKTPVDNFFLAGDWTIKEMTQCMESAVRSGYKCAEEIFKKYTINKTICDDAIV